MAPDADEDWEWIARIREGDRAAFEKIFRKYTARVLSLSFQFVRLREAAEDVAHEVFLKIYEKKAPLEARGKFSTWLYRVTVNASLDVLRHRKFEPRSLDDEREPAEAKTRWSERLPDPSPGPARVLEEEDLKRLVRLELERLPEKLRIPIVLFQFEELSYRDIAAIAGLTEKVVEKRLAQAREILRKRLFFLR